MLFLKLILLPFFLVYLVAVLMLAVVVPLGWIWEMVGKLIAPLLNKLPKRRPPPPHPGGWW